MPTEWGGTVIDARGTSVKVYSKLSGELVVIRHRQPSWAAYLPDLTLILSSPRSFARGPEVGFEAFLSGFPGS